MQNQKTNCMAVENSYCHFSIKSQCACCVVLNWARDGCSGRRLWTVFCVQSGKSLLRLRKNVLRPSSGSRSKSVRNQQEANKASSRWDSTFLRNVRELLQNYTASDSEASRPKYLDNAEISNLKLRIETVTVLTTLKDKKRGKNFDVLENYEVLIDVPLWRKPFICRWLYQ
jgi:hypothetical protein